MSDFDLAAIEFAENPESRCHCVLLLDVSTSMRGEPIQALNDGIQAFKNEVLEDDLAALRVEVAIVAFGSGAEVVQDFVTVDAFEPPSLTANGNTWMAAGINQALDLIERRKRMYRANGIAYYRPWVLMITDGAPTGESRDTVNIAAQRVKLENDNRQVAFFCVGVRDADLRRLTQMMPDRRPPLMLDGLKFNELFQWLSTSMSMVSKSQVDDEQIELPSPSGWANL